jgi:UDP-glucuronate decarboxylase
LASERLGWRPTTDLRTGLAHTISYFDGLLAGRQS